MSSAPVRWRPGICIDPALRKALDERGREDILIVVGGVIPPQDYDELYATARRRCSGQAR